MTELHIDFAEKVFICPICGEFESFAHFPMSLRARRFEDFKLKHKHEKKEVNTNNDTAALYGNNQNNADELL